MKTHTCLGSRDYTNPMRQTEGYEELAEFLRDHAQTVYVLRDGRAVLCSLWRFLEQTSSVPETMGEFIREKDSFYDGSVSRARAWADHVMAWLGSQPESVLRFEDLIRDPDTAIAGLARDLGLGAAVERVCPLPRPLKSLLQHRRARLFGIRPEATTQLGRPSGKKPPKWREAFSDEDLAFFWQEAGEAMEAAGYSR